MPPPAQAQLRLLPFVCYFLPRAMRLFSPFNRLRGHREVKRLAQVTQTSEACARAQAMPTVQFFLSTLYNSWHMAGAQCVFIE